MEAAFASFLKAGFERLAAWADTLDQINVFPVPDGDTGRNLVTSLVPLRDLGSEKINITDELLMAARGNSGNIAARYFTGFLEAGGGAGLGSRCRRGRELAYQAVRNPVQGTILSFFDDLIQALDRHESTEDGGWIERVLGDLEGSVKRTATQLPELEAAGVVDAGALGMFIFFDAFLKTLAGRNEPLSPILDLFENYLAVGKSWRAGNEESFCLDALLKVDQAGALGRLETVGPDLVAIEEGEYLKVHFHTADRATAHRSLESIGRLVSLATDNIQDQVRSFAAKPALRPVHVMTDAAGSLTRADAAGLGLTLLDSYIIIGHRSCPETRLDPTLLYGAMTQGIKVTTSQASIFERHQHYERILGKHPKVLYLCVGSAFTGNYQTVMSWKEDHDPDGRLVVVDTGSASGRLGLAALAVGQRALEEEEPDRLIDFAQRIVTACREYIFLDRLRWLAAGGRLSKTSALLGDALKIKPVFSPAPEGAKKVAVLRNREDQLRLALEKIASELDHSQRPWIMLEYTDNPAWVGGPVREMIAQARPEARIIVQPMSLTSGCHTGPGTWGLAFLDQDG